MSPGFENLPDEEHYEEEEEDEEDEDDIDFSGSHESSRLLSYAHTDIASHGPDLREQYEVRLEEGLDAFVVIDGLPVVPEDSKAKLVKFLLRKLNTVGKTREDAIFMPLGENGMSEGSVFVSVNSESTISNAESYFSVTLSLSTRLPNKPSLPPKPFMALRSTRSTPSPSTSSPTSIGMGERAVSRRSTTSPRSKPSRRKSISDGGSVTSRMAPTPEISS